MVPRAGPLGQTPAELNGLFKLTGVNPADHVQFKIVAYGGLLLRKV